MNKLPKLVCKNVWKLYGDKPKEFLHQHNNNPDQETIKKAGYIQAIRDASLEVYENEILVVMGLSGSGKSTLVRCMSRLVDPTIGKIFFENIDMGKLSKKELIEIRRHKMGMVFQHFALFPHRTVIENIAFPLEVQGIKKKDREKSALEIIELVGLEGREDYFPKELSGGQQQRVGIGRSLAVKPELWFLDEPFSSLDPLIRKEMQNEFLKIQSTLKKTIIFITHDFDEAIKLADRIIIMNEGVIVQIGSPEDLIMKPADDYVKEFTEDLPRERLLSVKSIMNNNKNPSNSSSVYEDEKIFKILEKVLSEGSVSVINRSNEIVGSLDKETISKFIYN
ncbi:MAG: betaine/proline/choline family ABC transporter ATP-binding protein [Alphaproteobacteria bacterium]|jgi:glycine betaine/proline transport system ATP-binding protein|nr:betaine/proline/choline family ABC transporter ATP-binding protein [Alphaproteobacteria bacterium]